MQRRSAEDQGGEERRPARAERVGGDRDPGGGDGGCNDEPGADPPETGRLERRGQAAQQHGDEHRPGHQFVVRARSPERDGGNEDRDEERGDGGLETQSQRHGKGRPLSRLEADAPGFRAGGGSHERTSQRRSRINCIRKFSAVSTTLPEPLAGIDSAGGASAHRGGHAGQQPRGPGAGVD